ncbi:unnamed protein product [Ilex paraguariensis]|uniref:Protein SIEVE ELEMENT OCCLUSION B-like n=1 Tax=Ilex paraguariensis TaxID=185542 RepID=A0ABC8RLN3_9AQUA
MATTEQPPTLMQPIRKSTERPMSVGFGFASAMTTQIEATHFPDGREVDVKPILSVIEDILLLATPGTHEHVATLENKATLRGSDGMSEPLSLIIQRVSFELSSNCSGADAHGMAMAILKMLSSYSWAAKMVISLAAFAINHGEFWLIRQLYGTDPLAKSLAGLKQLPEIIERYNSQKSRLDAITNLIKVMVDVTKSMTDFKELPSQYLSPDQPPLSTAMAHFPSAVYWTIRSMMACASQITSLSIMSYEHTTTTDARQLSTLAHTVQNIHEYLKTQLALCYQYIAEKKHDEYFQMLIRLFKMSHLDNIKVLKPLIYNKDDLLPLMDGSNKTRVKVDVLQSRNILLLISDLDLSQDEIRVLAHIYDSRIKQNIQYEVVWLPITDRSKPLNAEHQQKLEKLQSMMPWYSVHHPSLLEPAVIKFVKEVWNFAKKMILVPIDPQGNVVSPNALHMVWIWGNMSYPFTSVREEALWRKEAWRLNLLVDGIDRDILGWIAQEKFICLFGGEDIEWIRRFTTTAKDVAKAAGIDLKMVYVGKSSAKERVQRVSDQIKKNQFSSWLADPTLVWYFWARLESMLYSKVQYRENFANDEIVREVVTLVGYDGSDQGWAVISRGTAEITKAKGDTFLTTLTKFKEWEDSAKQYGFVQALRDYFQRLHTPQHCNRLVLPGIDGGISEMMVCSDCGRPMEKYYLYRCCID